MAWLKTIREVSVVIIVKIGADTGACGSQRRGSEVVWGTIQEKHSPSSTNAVCYQAEVYVRINKFSIVETI